MKDKVITILRNRIQTIIPMIHFFLTFIWERKRFIFSNNFDFLNTVARTDSIISGNAELIIVYIISKIFCGIIIYMGWKLFFSLVQGKIPKSTKLVFSIILIVGLVVGIILYPIIFGLEIDNYMNYSMAIRFLPTYWQNIYTGALYAGCLMTIPHPVSIFIFQWTIFVAVVAYLYSGIEKISKPSSNKKYISLLLFLLPEAYYIAFNAYRNNFYTILVLYYITSIYLKIKIKQKVTTVEIVKFIFITAFIMVWRSEGILIGVGGICFFLLYIYEKNIKRYILIVVMLLVAFTGMNRIQSIGADKYYGQDYMILNTTNVLYNIFNNPEANLTYSGAKEDLKAIGNVIPVEILKQYAMRGYRNYNWTNGHLDFNQSLVNDETANNYMSAYYRIVLHNISDYLDIQIKFFYTCLQFNATRTTFAYTGDKQVELESFVYDQWKVGQEEVRETFLTRRWENNKVRGILSEIISEMISVWREMLVNSGINAIIHALAIIIDLLIALLEIIKWLQERKKVHFGFALAFLIIIGELMAVMLFMPEGRATYLYPMLYASYLMIFIYFMHVSEKVDFRKEGTYK
jgi:hypothetical protein